LVTYKIGFPGWPEPILDSVTGLGRQLQRGGLHQPPFSFLGLASGPRGCGANKSGHPKSRQLRLSRRSTVNAGRRSKKVSGRWGHRPLGRGDGGYSNPKSVWHLPSNCAREQQDGTQEQKQSYSRKPKQLPTTLPVCSLPNPPSIARRIHSLQYFPPPRRPLFWYGSTSGFTIFTLLCFTFLWLPRSTRPCQRMTCG